MIRNSDVRAGIGESVLVDELLSSGDYLLTHGELLSVVIPHPQPTEDETILFPAFVAGALTIASIDERQIRLKWSDPYTLHESESITDVAPDGDMLVIDALQQEPVRVDSWFVKQERLIDLIDGRNVVVESVEVRLFDWPVPGAVADSSTPTSDLISSITAWFVAQGFTSDGLGKSLRKRVNDRTELVAALNPESFRVENESRRHPVTVSLGVARRDLNRMCDWLSGNPDRPWRWTMQEHAFYFSSACPRVWRSDSAPDMVIGDLGPALEGLEEFGSNDRALHAYLWNDPNPIHTNLYQRLRLTSTLIEGWNDQGEQELAEWKKRTSSRNQITLFEASLRRYLETGDLPHWLAD